MTTYSFHPLQRTDLTRLRQWQAQPHVSAWWGSDPDDDDAVRRDPRVDRFIVQADGTPFAFMQDYSVHGWPDHHFAALPPGSRGIDQYIGDPAMIGQGHGPAFIATRVAALFAAGAPVIATDPHPDNTRAIAAYKKVGFTAFAPPRETPWGLILPMKRLR